ncbi:alpha/beta hydrolase [Actinocorallia sp. B10E7]|uniref:alpha/beta hydrolase n=1 Tax=Actinocorallia sp. B10E7 TaxID=3153558 RepID=UPI00325C3826
MTADPVHPSPSGHAVTKPQPSPQPSSIGARILARALHATVRPILDHGPVTPAVLRAAWLSDYAGLLLPAPRGTRRQHVPFPGFDGELVMGPGVHGRNTGGRMVLYFHGGAFISCGLRTHCRLVARISTAAQAPVLHIAYRQLPDATLVQTVEDCLAAYRHLLDRGIPADRIVIAGDSAGGHLAFATALAATLHALPAPAGIAALSPWLDLECAHNIHHPNAPTDPYLPIHQLARIATMLTPDGTPPPSVLDADLTALPPVLIHVGSIEALRSDAELMTDRLHHSGIRTDLHIWPGQIHVFQAFADLTPEGHQAITEIGTFIRTMTATPDHRKTTATHPPQPGND